MVSNLLEDAKIWNTWKVLLDSHIEMCQSLTIDLTSDVMSREVEVHYKLKGMNERSIKERMAEMTSKLGRRRQTIIDELEKRIERSIQLVHFPVVKVLRFLINAYCFCHRSSTCRPFMKSTYLQPWQSV